MIRSLPIAIAALGLAAAAPPAAAQTYALSPGFSLDSTKVVTDARIPIGDLDLGSAAGARAALARIEAAADAVCGGAENAASDYQRADYRECRRLAVAGAVARARSAALTRLASRRSGDRQASR